MIRIATRTINCSMLWMDGCASLLPRLRMMWSVELGVPSLPRRGTPGRRTRGAVEQLEKISSSLTPSRRRASEIAEFLPYRVSNSVTLRQGLLKASLSLLLSGCQETFDSKFCPTCPSQSVRSIAHFCPTVKANFPQRCRVLRPTLVLLTN